MLKEFKEFAIKGNLVELAVAFIIGAAFGRIVSSFIGGVVMPVVGALVFGADFSDLVFKVSEAELAADGSILRQEVVIKYGVFITESINFIIVALVMFLLVKGISKLKKAEEETEEIPEPSPEEKLLREIRDLTKLNVIATRRITAPKKQ